MITRQKSYPYFLALLTSLLLYSSSPGAWSLPYLMWFSLVPFFLAMDKMSAKQSAKLGFLCGLIYQLALIYWIIIALGRYGGLPVWLSIPALIGLSAYMAAYLSCFAFLYSWLKNIIFFPSVWLAPIIWVSLDLIKGWLFTGFGWQDLSYSQYKYTELIQASDLGGHFFITFLIVLTNSCIASIIINRHPDGIIIKGPKKSKSEVLFNLILPITIVVLTIIYGHLRYRDLDTRLAEIPSAQVSVIQGNIDQNQKWKQEQQAETINTYLALSEKAMAESSSDLVIWPETALPFFPLDSPLFERIISWVKKSSQTALITGAPHYINDQKNRKIKYYNSAFNLVNSKDDFKLERYDKMHLVPFGEYVPFNEYLPEAMPIVQAMGNFSPGSKANLLSSDKLKMGILICFESIFPEMARQRSKSGANLLINLTNDAWYGRSSAPWQQISMVVFRAVENRRSIARSANTGISCLIDPLGRLLDTSPLFEKYFLSRRVPLYTGSAFYTEKGHLFPMLCLLLLSLMILYGMFHKKGLRAEG